MSTTEYAMKLMARYEPQVPIPELVEQLNRFYHAREARYYDRQHPEIHQQIGPMWSEMITVGLAGKSNHSLRVLDFGCGTGFEAAQLLASPYCTSVSQLVCYDLSPEMLEVCRNRLNRFSCFIEYVSELEQVSVAHGRFDVLLTNSLLHHLPDPLGTIRSLSHLLSSEAVWLAGHEPSSRFYRNPSCCSVLEAFRRHQRFRKYLSPRKYLRRAMRLLRFNRDPARGAAKSAVEKDLVRRRPSRGAVGSLVDFHVARSSQEADAGRGFDFREIEENLHGGWDLAWQKSYSFMGPFYEEHLPKKWLAACQELKLAHPNDGSNSCAVWKRRLAA